MKLPTTILGLSLAAFSWAGAQFPEPPAGDKATLNAQAGQIFEALKPAVAKVAHGVVEVRVWRKRVGFGTVVDEGMVLVKWSEVRRDVRSLSCRTGDGSWLPAKLAGIYREADLAVLRVEGLQAEPLPLHGGNDLKLGTFLALARPDGEAAAMGVVSVMPRSLVESDRAFLGILMDITYPGPGVRVRGVQEETGAERSGMQQGDVITHVESRPVNGSFELSSALQRLAPGQTVKIAYRRGEDEKVAEVVLGGRRESRPIPYSRMERMNNMGGHRYSGVKDGFRDVIQSDMQLDPEDCGAPVIDLEGNVVGLAVARAGRIKTFLIPAASVRKLLGKDPDKPRIEELAGRAQPVREIESEDPLDAIGRKLEEMRRLMDEIEEMER